MEFYCPLNRETDHAFPFFHDRYFGKYNADKLIEGLMQHPEAKEILPEQQKRWIHESIRSHARMPFTNNWRVSYADWSGRNKTLSEDCRQCTVPAYSGDNGVKIADRLFENGQQVYGWDVEWTGGWGGSGTETADEFMAKMKSAYNRLDGKIMVLTHDHVFASPDELYKFFVRAKEEGYVFRTVDTYGTD